MLKINKKVEYALMVLKYMGEKNPKDIISAREVCDKFQIPFDTTAKVMQSMNNHQLLQSVKGIKGGYTLEKSLTEFNYTDLVEMIEGKNPDSFCVTNKGVCGLHSTCNIISPVERLNQLLNDYLSSLTLQEILFGEINIPNLNFLENLNEKTS